MSRTGVKRFLRPITQTNPASPVSESYRTLRSNVEAIMESQGLQVLQVTSSTPSEGKTYISSNLSIVLANAGRRVLLIDANQRNPQLHRHFEIENELGVSDVVTKGVPLGECVKPLDSTLGLFILTSGTTYLETGNIFNRYEFSDLISRAKSEYDFVVIDSPAVMSTVDSLDLSRKSDAILYVVDSRKSSRRITKQGVQRLTVLGCNIIGVVLNKVKRRNVTQDYYVPYHNASAPSINA